jgi:hypothetical protein
MVRTAISSGLLTIFAVLALAACSGAKPAPTILMSCPRASVLEEAANLTRFKPGAIRQPENADFVAEIVSVAIKCRPPVDASSINGEIEMLIVAAQGLAGGLAGNEGAARPGWGGSKVAYFVAILDRSQKILAKEVFEVSLGLSAEQTQATLNERLEPRIPLQPGQTGNDVQIMVGFQLSPDELAWNRQQAGR